MSFCRKYHHINRCEIQFSKLIWIIDLLTTTKKKLYCPRTWRLQLPSTDLYDCKTTCISHKGFYSEKKKTFSSWSDHTNFLVPKFFDTQFFSTHSTTYFMQSFFNLQNPIPKCLVVQTCTLIRVPPLIWLVFQNSIQNHQVMLRGILMIRYSTKKISDKYICKIFLLNNRFNFSGGWLWFTTRWR